MTGMTLDSELLSSAPNIGTPSESLVPVEVLEDAANATSDQQNETQHPGSHTSAGDASTTGVDALHSSGVSKSRDIGGVVQSQFSGLFPGGHLYHDGADIVHALLSKAGAVAERFLEGCDVRTIAALGAIATVLHYLYEIFTYALHALRVDEAIV